MKKWKCIHSRESPGCSGCAHADKHVRLHDCNNTCIHVRRHNLCEEVS